MKYLMINEGRNLKLHGGADRRRLELLKNLCLDSEDCLILIGNIPIELKECNNIYSIPCNFEKLGKLSYNVSALVAMLRIAKDIRSQRYDIAVSWGGNSTAIMWICGIKNIVTCNRDDPYGYAKLVYTRRVDKGKLLLWRLIEGAELMISKKIIVQCRYDKEALVKRHQIIIRKKKCKIDVQMNNVNASWMKSKIENRKKSSRDEIVVAFISSFSNGTSQAISRKGNDILLPAIAKLIREGYPIRLLVAGGGTALERVKEKYIGYPQIEFKGFCDVIPIYEMSDFAVCPSILDSCPNALLEALALGVPVYGSKVSGIIDILADDQFMFSPTKESVYKKLKEVITDRRYLIDADRQVAIVKRLTFDWGKEMKKLIDEVAKN